MDPRTVRVAAAAAAAGLIAGLGLSALVSAYRTSARLPAHKSVFVLMVKLKLREGGLAKFKELWAPLAEYCRLHEPATLSYELCVSSDDETEVMIYERYVAESDLTAVHQSSEAFKEFGRITREQHPDLIVGKSRSTWVETNVGYMGC